MTRTFRAIHTATVWRIYMLLGISWSAWESLLIMREASPPTTREAGCVAPLSFETVSIGDSYIRAALQGTGLSTTATTLICNAWREGTKKQYDCTLRRWREFCHTRQIHPITPHVNDVVEFLSFLYDNGGGGGGGMV